MVDERIAHLKTVKERMLERIGALALPSLQNPDDRTKLIQLLSERFDDGIRELEKLRARCLRRE